jgi:hypothetical protein
VTIANVKIWDKYGIQQSKLNVQHSKARRLLLNLVAAVDATNLSGSTAAAKVSRFRNNLIHYERGCCEEFNNEAS